MFNRFPYWGWLIFSVLLWTGSTIYFRAHREAVLPEQMARSVNEDLAQKERAFNAFMQDRKFIRRMFTDSLTGDEVKKLANLPFYIYAYNGDSLAFWNNNSVIGLDNDSLQGGTSIRKNQKGVFIRQYLRQTDLGDNEKLIVMFPILITYPLENDYLHAHFVASDIIPVKTKITTQPTNSPDEYKIKMSNGSVGYLVFNRDDIQKWVPDAWLIFMLIGAVLGTIAWIQHIVLYLTRGESRFLAPLIIIAIVILARMLLYEWGLPFHMDTLTFFSPTLYASSRYLSSLGDLFISILFVLWVLVFVARYTTHRTYFTAIKSQFVKSALGVGFLALLTCYVLFCIKIIRSLVLDSRISFDVTHFYTVTIYTGCGLLAIISIMAISCSVVYLFNVQFKVLISNRWLKLLALAAVFSVFYLVLGRTHEEFYWYLLAGLLLFVFLLDIPSFPLTSKLFEPQMIIWALIICVYSTAIIHFYNEVKERVTRMAFVEQRLSPHHDDQLELSFDKTAKLLGSDKQLKNFFYKQAAPAARKQLNQHLDSLYLAGLGRYQTTVYLYDDEYKPLFNKDTLGYNELMNEKTESVITNSSYLFYKESILNKHYYLAYLPIYSDTVNNVIGYVFIGLDQKKAATETVYPELLQPSTNKPSAGDFDYSYAMYINGKLITQTNDYAFPVRLRYDTLKEQEFVYETNEGFSTLYTKIADKRTAVVVHHHSELIETVTLFSYIFGIQVLIALVIFLYQLYLSWVSGKFQRGRFIRFTLKRRVHFSMLTIVLMSFVIIGWVTILFFTSEYRKSNDNKLQAALQVAKQSVQDYLAREQAFNGDAVFGTVSKSPAFKSFITTLANNQKVDINIFDDNGDLLSSSQDDIYDKGLISRKMRSDAYFNLDSKGRSLVIQNEKVAGLSYTSAYQALRNEQGATLGYINVPFFSSEKDLDFQISNILVTLLNLYAFLFLVSTLLTVLVTGWVTRTFDIIIKQLGNVNLERNERIEWPHNDEIGKLVKEYNKMVKKVEENAARLAQSERETAWREMARQVAHEIKNPLTPMKLNIQYLQSAMRNDNPNIKQLTERVSVSIIEQIDNLSYIASEFSNFAKMPEAKPEELEPVSLLTKAVELYTKDEELKVTIEHPNDYFLVLCDHSQLLRVFTNLLENAKQAIPDDREGNIKVSVTREDSDVVIAIADNGTGISEETARRIFQPYFTTKSSGTGLGLAMTKKIIEFWKGAIWFETIENEGTTFFIRLPLVGGE